jgi:hypothetical protein
MTPSSSPPQCFERIAALGLKVATRTADLSRSTLHSPGGAPHALPGWIVELPLPEAARLLLAILWRSR